MITKQLDDIATDWIDCVDCRLHEDRTNQVWYRFEGDPDRTEIMILGEAPGSEEDKDGLPFVGRSGAMLNKLMYQAGIKNGFITNTVCCRPKRNRNPFKIELKSCWPRLFSMIDIVKPKVIVCAGNVPAHWILETDKSMRTMMEKIYQWECGDVESKIIPVYHPAYLLRKRSPYINEKVLDRLMKARSIVESTNND